MCRGFSELAPLLAYLTIALQDSVINAGLKYTEAEQQQFGNLYTGYVQNIADGFAPADEVTAAPTSDESTGVFASLIANESLLGGAFLPVSNLTLAHDVDDVATSLNFCMLCTKCMPCSAIGGLHFHVKFQDVLQPALFFL